MYDYEFEPTTFGGYGTMPCGEVHEFATEEEYYIAYTEEENEIVDEMARLSYLNEPIDYPDDYIFV